ncbi:aldehyde dehydrogenase family protein [Candidatus Roseilinea sp. NK_OTU-006]|jgi:1-pyrroline-5-carboxylate dehydrogenase|uniref:aldehyde dehydrogenase family protein n=1 Tax=Candidatus Roseilinea sp. NK_OTU-006 TaxID=2704250 RepID=UPI00145E7D83|nr:aldehyde dehydrogenase family protein [Candidatus Roseilinea sp. NK_OTU-006]
MPTAKAQAKRTTPRKRKQSGKPAFQITYANLSSALSDPDLLARFDKAFAKVRANIGEHARTYPMFIGGVERFAAVQFAKTTPIDTSLTLGYFQRGDAQDAQAAIAAAKAAFPAWSGTPWKRRVAMMRKVAALINRRLFDIAAWVSLEVGKSRAEAIGDVKETADLIDYYCNQMEVNAGFEKPLLPEGGVGTSRSVLKPYGVWAVVSPFNFPMALTGGPAGAALIAGNTVVIKPASDTPMASWLLTECLRDAGLPAGVFNYVTGPGSVVGEELVNNPDVAGMTFTGSFDVGFSLIQRFSQRMPRPLIAEMGGKNAVIVSDKADLEKAAEGVVRAAFGLSGQKCSATSRVYVHRAVKEPFVDLLKRKTEALKVGDPTQAGVFTGPVCNRGGYQTFQRAVEQAQRDGGIFVTGGRVLTEGELARGFFCALTIVDGLPLDHPLFCEELFTPFLLVAAVDSLEQAMAEANKVQYGLTAGFFSKDRKEIKYFLDHIQAGTVYVNRERGATTGAWPGNQSFGGWKASGNTGRGAGGPYYLQQYMREQSQTVF